jgi:uncharacterized protein
MFIRVFAVALTLAASAPVTSALAQTYPEPLGDTVSDFAEVLDATDEGRISRILTETRDATGVQMVVVTLSGLDAYGGAGMRMEDFGKALFNAWGVGGEDRNDGIMLLLDIESRDARIALGAGYDPVYDGRAARVLATAVLPELREGQMASGIEAGIVSARERLITPFLAGQPISVSDGFEAEETSSYLTPVAGIAAVLGLAGFSFWRSRKARRTCPNCGAQTLERSREIIDRPTRSESGTGMQHLICSACGFTDRRSYPVSYSSREARHERSHDSNGRSESTGGGSRGFGGGRSSGGGASGKW